MHESNGYIFTMNIKQLRKLFFICTSTLLVLPVGCSKEKMTYKPTEEVDLSDIDLNQLPISVDELQRYLLTQYIEYENYAGFTCNEIDYKDPENINFAEYILELATYWNFELSEEDLNVYSEIFRMYDPDFETMDLSSLKSIARVQQMLNVDCYTEQIYRRLNELREEALSDLNITDLLNGGLRDILSIDEISETIGRTCDQKSRDVLRQRVNSLIQLKPADLDYISLLIICDAYDVDMTEILPLTEQQLVREESELNTSDYSIDSINRARKLLNVNEILKRSSEAEYDYFNTYEVPEYLGPGYAEYYDNTLIAMLKLASDLQFEVPVCENAEYYIAKAVSTYFVPNYAYEISSIYTYY